MQSPTGKMGKIGSISVHSQRPFASAPGFVGSSGSGEIPAACDYFTLTTLNERARREIVLNNLPFVYSEVYNPIIGISHV